MDPGKHEGFATTELWSESECWIEQEKALDHGDRFRIAHRLSRYGLTLPMFISTKPPVYSA